MEQIENLNQNNYTFEPTEKKAGPYNMVSYTDDNGNEVYFPIINMPTNIDENTPIIFYYCGNGCISHEDYQSVQKGMSEFNNCDALIVGGDVKSLENNFVILDGIEKVLGIPSENYNSIAFSNGAYISVRVGSYLSITNPDFDEGVMVFVDPNPLHLDSTLNGDDIRHLNLSGDFDDPKNYPHYWEVLQDFQFIIYGKGKDLYMSKNNNENLGWGLSMLCIDNEQLRKLFGGYLTHQAKNLAFWQDGGANFILDFESLNRYIVSFGEKYGVNLEDYFANSTKKIIQKIKLMTIDNLKNISRLNDPFLKSKLSQLNAFVSSVYKSKFSVSDYSSTTNVPNIENPKMRSVRVELSNHLMNVEKIIENGCIIDESIKAKEFAYAHMAQQNLNNPSERL